MPFAYLEGIRTQYQVVGAGPPLLLLSPLGDDGSAPQRWHDRVWRGFRPAECLSQSFQVITYDRRESGNSGGRVEPLSYLAFARQATALLDHLGVQRAFLLSSCVGCSVALALAADFAERCRALLLHWPVGGFRWLNTGRTNFDRHCAFVSEHGLSAVVERARQARMFWTNPESGPWASVIAADQAFVRAYECQNLDRYLHVVAQSRDNLFNDAMPLGVKANQLMAMQMPAFIMPGDDAWHTTSSAHLLSDLIPNAKISPLMPRQQNATTIESWVYDCAAACGCARPSAVA
jgi:pimeloyl-ACP methyl ester carboxylesterase